MPAPAFIGIASYLVRAIGVRGAVGGMTRFSRAAAGAAKSAAANAGKMGKDVGKTTGLFGGLQNTLAGVKENLLPVWAGFELLKNAFNLVLGPSSVLQTIFQTISDIWGALVDSILASLAPVWIPLIELFAEIVTDILPEMVPMFEELATMIADFFVPLLREFMPEFKLLAKIFFGIVALGLAAVFIAIGAALAGLGALVRRITGGFQWFLDVLSWIADTFGKVDQMIGSVRWGDIGKGIANGIIGSVEWALNHIVDMINTLFGWTGVSLPHVSVPRLARGGIVTQPTLAMLGERGPEAVIPLTGPGGGGLGLTVINYVDVTIHGGAGGGVGDRDVEAELEALFERLGRLGGEEALVTLRRRS